MGLPMKNSNENGVAAAHSPLDLNTKPPHARYFGSNPSGREQGEMVRKMMVLRADRSSLSPPRLTGWANAAPTYHCTVQ